MTTLIKIQTPTSGTHYYKTIAAVGASTLPISVPSLVSGTRWIDKTVNSHRVKRLPCISFVTNTDIIASRDMLVQGEGGALVSVGADLHTLVIEKGTKVFIPCQPVRSKQTDDNTPTKQDLTAAILVEVEKIYKRGRLDHRSGKRVKGCVWVQRLHKGYRVIIDKARGAVRFNVVGGVVRGVGFTPLSDILEMLKKC